ncbi:MAG: D-tyrosyl-tRNA(Tyr) deacylase [Candidatus Aminicenantes bacterium]|nr:D-tyrosyl-tRNA(Tyr) deacylase [Candidatus Aminicenantes bacterium]MCK5005085.1 D-tyrosyl-tRNA(Tyr) deacylase [Candidatus Aminicenantes bacterium]
MRIVVQRVSSADVKVNSKIVGKIGTGLLIYAGIEKGDSEREIEFVAEKVLNLRIFPDEDDKMDRAVLDVPGGAILSISQFTLASFIRKGRRPDFSNALEPEKAEKLYDHFCEKLSSKIKVERGIFGAMMDISSVNDGPVTFIIEKNFNNI